MLVDLTDCFCQYLQLTKMSNQTRKLRKEETNTTHDIGSIRATARLLIQSFLLNLYLTNQNMYNVGLI